MSKTVNEMTDDIIHSTKYYIKYITGAIFVNLQQEPFKLGRLMIVLNKNTPTATTISVPMATYCFPVNSSLISILSDF